MTVQECIDIARQLINDPDEQDWTDPQLLNWYNQGTLVVRSNRPDTRLDSAGAEIAYVVQAVGDDVDDLFAEPEKWCVALTHYIAHMAFSQDAGDERELSRSAEQLARFEAMLIQL